jgi:hypothetical protein
VSEPLARLEDIPRLFATEVNRQRYCSPFVVLSVGATEASDLTVQVTTFRTALHGLIMALKHVIREKLVDWVQPFGSIKFVFMSILPPSNAAAFVSTLTPGPASDRRTLFNTTMKEVASETQNLYLDRDTEITDPSDYRLPTPYDGYMPSRQGAAKITRKLATLIYPHIIELSQNKAKK